MLKIKVPASTSNFGSGFDAFGLALSLYNEFYVEPSDSYNVQIEGEGSNLPTGGRDKKSLRKGTAGGKGKHKGGGGGVYKGLL